MWPVPCIFHLLGDHQCTWVSPQKETIMEAKDIKSIWRRSIIVDQRTKCGLLQIVLTMNLWAQTEDLGSHKDLHTVAYWLDMKLRQDKEINSGCQIDNSSLCSSPLERLPYFPLQGRHHLYLYIEGSTCMCWTRLGKDWKRLILLQWWQLQWHIALMWKPLSNGSELSMYGYCQQTYMHLTFTKDLYCSHVVEKSKRYAWYAKSKNKDKRKQYCIFFNRFGKSTEKIWYWLSVLLLCTCILTLVLPIWMYSN